ncbi:hypothetical protein DFP72DRAFT_941126 [Ephemerocybe angulata]|uniref:Uncharacterized protein n=1 Tax=Ephemerocybe angulata TaxID=980116 RepID=A0A8H6LTS5_9AGAR|nr:hypothetical protein DFP72DRAFT_941126 [Tulosesus angulatus]
MSDRYTEQDYASQNKGAKAGTKVRGVFEAVHGAGENIRGSALSAVDSLAGQGPNRNDEIARQGQQETQMGVNDMHTGPTAGARPMRSTAQPAVAPGNTAPHHHRDDAISGLHQRETRELRETYETERRPGGFDQTERRPGEQHQPHYD